MFILVPTLIGIILGCFLAARLHMDEMETITGLCFSTVGAWIGAGFSEYPLDPRLDHAYNAFSLALTIIGAVGAVFFYKFVFHPHQKSHFHMPHFFEHDERK